MRRACAGGSLENLSMVESRRRPGSPIVVPSLQDRFSEPLQGGDMKPMKSGCFVLPRSVNNSGDRQPELDKAGLRGRGIVLANVRDTGRIECYGDNGAAKVECFACDR